MVKAITALSDPGLLMLDEASSNAIIANELSVTGKKPSEIGLIGIPDDDKQATKKVGVYARLTDLNMAAQINYAHSAVSNVEQWVNEDGPSTAFIVFKTESAA